jgi:hypothetical protein
MTATVLPRKRLVLRGALIAVSVLAAALWLGNAWSPSSYGIVLKAFGARDTGIVLGEPRAVRSDEWGVVTPYVQATVNNGFRRYNETSFYREDLRTLVALPLADWGLAFKPDQWLYPFVGPAYAFSFQHLVYIVAFLAGYALLFARIGLSPGAASLLSLALFFTAFVQFWWTTFAPDLAYFPWVLLCLAIRRPALRAPLFLWAAVAWMVGYFYPPIFIPLAVAAAAVYWSALYPERGPRGAALDGVVALAACGVVVFYLRDYVAATWSSIFPGLRRMDGGGVPAAMQLQALFPTAFLTRFETDLAGYNVCEASVVGSWYLLAAACFVDHRRLLAAPLPSAFRRLIVAALAAWLVLFAWQTLPIPKELAHWVLLDRVPPRRTVFASGFLLLLVAAVLVQGAGVRFSAARDGADAAWMDVAAIALVVVALIGGAAVRRNGAAALAGGSALLGLVAFGPFNPIQSARPIFEREATALTRELDARQKANPQGVLVSDQFGATLNGWGYRSAAHVLFVPELDVWRRLFPDLSAAERDRIFNRYAHIVLRDVRAPELVNHQVIAVPRRVFENRVPP